MNKQVNDFFCFPNMLMSDEMRGKISAATDLRLVGALSRILGCGIYLVDYEKNKVLFMSDNVAEWCGIPKENINSYDDYVKCVPDDDYKMLIEINEAVFSFLRDKPDDEIMQYIVSYNFHLRQLLMHQYFTPVVVNDGIIKTGLFILTLPSGQESGQITMRKTGEADYYEYSMEEHEWQYNKGIVLTDTEKKVLWLSAQGMTVDDISDEICKSADTVKTHKKRLFKKLGVSSTSEALICAMNKRLL